MIIFFILCFGLVCSGFGRSRFSLGHQRSRLRDAEALLREKSALFKRSSGEKCCSAFRDFSGHGKAMDTLGCVGSLLHISFIRTYDVCNHFYGNDETKFSTKLKFWCD